MLEDEVITFTFILRPSVGPVLVCFVLFKTYVDLEFVLPVFQLRHGIRRGASVTVGVCFAGLTLVSPIHYYRTIRLKKVGALSSSIALVAAWPDL